MKKIAATIARIEQELANNDGINPNIRYFRKAAYLLLLLKMLLLWPALDTFYHHVITTQSALWYQLPKLLFFPALQPFIQWIWLLACAVVACGIVCKSNRMLSVLIFIVSLNYMNLTYLAINNGDLLLNFFVFMLILANERAKPGEIRQMFNNAMALILKINMAVLYYVNAYGKIIHENWRNGAFMKDVWQLDYYVNPHVLPQWLSNTTMATLTGWSVMVFEFAFAFLIWFKPFRTTILCIGVLFHLAIGLLLSLPDFSLTMLAAYLLFVDGEKLKKIAGQVVIKSTKQKKRFQS